MGTMLMAAGLAPGEAPERWLVARPDVVAGVHRAYVAAGCDAVLTCTFGASSAKLEAAGLAGRAGELNRVAADLARGAAGDRVLVLGDIGPTGLQMPPVGGASPAEVEAALAEQVEALAAAGVDALLVETMYDLREALAAVAAARRSGLPVLASMTFEARRRGHFTIMGDPLVASVSALADAGAFAVGCNCSVTASVMAGMVREARAAVALPLLAQPNAGQPRVAASGVTYDATPEAFAAEVLGLVEAGAGLVGGCCGTTPEHIRAARTALGGAR
jgi:5-methyltetrahydrofolate--homocysteine methyltransferase